MATHDDTTPSFGRLYEEALRKFNAVAAIAHLLGNDENTDDVMRDAAQHAWQVAHDGAELMPQLWERHMEEYDRKPAPTDEPREWTGDSLETEEKALMARIFALPESAVGRLMDFCLTVVTAHRPDKKPNAVTLEEIASMLEREATARSIQSFWHLKYRGIAQLVEAPAATTDKDDALHAETVAEVREDNPGADEREVALRVAIRESFSATSTEEDAAYQRIAAAVQGGNEGPL